MDAARVEKDENTELSWLNRFDEELGSPNRFWALEKFDALAEYCEALEVATRLACCRYRFTVAVIWATPTPPSPSAVVDIFAAL